MSRLEEIIERYVDDLLNDGYFKDTTTITSKDYLWLIKQVELYEECRADATVLHKRVKELENRNKELEYASKFNGELNEFLQKRKLPPNTLGMHVVDVVMNYVEELEDEQEYMICPNCGRVKTDD